MRSVVSVAVLAGVLCLAGVAAADWDQGDGHKMHFPQLPDPNGWDVDFSITPEEVADDWQCSASGPVKDIHLWYSWQGDEADGFSQVRMRIYDNVPVGSGGATFSQPGTMLWERSFVPGQFTVRVAGTGSQGWYNAVYSTILPNDHSTYWQLNISDIADPFIQEKDQIYWLAVVVFVENFAAGFRAGWKTSNDHFMDNAVIQGQVGGWQELTMPGTTTEPMDMAFVITPEPATMGLLALGAAGLTMARRRRRRRR
jgi:hypothetical protein